MNYSTGMRRLLGLEDFSRLDSMLLVSASATLTWLLAVAVYGLVCLARGH